MHMTSVCMDHIMGVLIDHKGNNMAIMRMDGGKPRQALPATAIPWPRRLMVAQHPYW